MFKYSTARKSLFVYRLVHAPVISDARAKAGFDSQTESFANGLIFLYCNLILVDVFYYSTFSQVVSRGAEANLRMSDDDDLDYRSLSAYAKIPTKVG